jgi:hypothetical protein
MIAEVVKSDNFICRLKRPVTVFAAVPLPEGDH